MRPAPLNPFWLGVEAYMYVWSEIGLAGLEATLALQRTWLEAGLHAARWTNPPAQPGEGASDAPVAPIVAAAIEDLRQCGVAVVRSQQQVIESWRH
jgi:hypothetical protein